MISLEATSESVIYQRLSFLWDLFLFVFDGSPSDIADVGREE